MYIFQTLFVISLDVLVIQVLIYITAGYTKNNLYCRWVQKITHDTAGYNHHT